MSNPIFRQPGERIFCFLLVVFSLYLFWQAYQIAGFSSLSSSGAFPLATTAVMIITSCIVFINSLKLPKDENSTFFYHCLPPVVAIVMAAILVYAVILESLGFILSSALFLFCTIQYLYRRNVLTTISLTLLALIIIYIVFRLLFQVILPEGIVPEREIIAAIRKLWGES